MSLTPVLCNLAAERNRGRASHQTLALTVNTVSPWTGWTPLMCAAANGHLAATHAVLEAGPDVSLLCT